MKKILKLSVLLVFFLTGCVYISLPAIEPLTEKTVGGEGKNKIVLLDISGVIKDSGHRDPMGLRPEAGLAARIREALDLAATDKRVKGLVLRIDSPGGDVTASDTVYHEIMAFKKQKGMPVVAHFMGKAASGAYYIASSADEIIAQPTTITGGIGVVAYSVGLTGLMKKIGITNRTIKSGEMKDMNSPLKEMTPGERRVLKSLIDELYRRFLGVVLDGRKGKIDRKALEAISDGRVFTANQALELRLIDRIGYLEGSIEEAKRLAGIEKARVVTYVRPGTYTNNIYSASPVPAPRMADILGMEPGSLLMPAGLKLMYLWTP